MASLTNKLDLAATPFSPAAQAAADRQAQIDTAIAPPEKSGGYHLQFNTAHDPDVSLAAENTFYENGFMAAGVSQQLGQALLDALTATQAIYSFKDNPAAPESDADTERREIANKARALDEGYRVKILSDPDLAQWYELGLKSFSASFRKELESKFSFNSAESYAAVAAHGRAKSLSKK